MAFELAISPDHLRVYGYSRIFEGQSTDDFNEIPDIPANVKKGRTNYIIQDDQSFCVQFNWRILGIFANFLGGGSWKCDVLFEQMGGGETFLNPSGTAKDLGKPGQSYRVDVNVAPQQLKPGVYRVVTRIQYYFANGQPGPLVSFEDEGIIQIYKDL